MLGIELHSAEELNIERNLTLLPEALASIRTKKFDIKSNLIEFLVVPGNLEGLRCESEKYFFSNVIE